MDSFAYVRASTSKVAPRVHVRVVRMTAEQLPLVLPPRSTFGHVKDQVLSHWSIAPACQHLAVGSIAVDDCEVLSRYADDASPELVISLAVSQNQAVKDLKANIGADRKLHALLKLKQGKNVVGEAERVAAMGRLADRHIQVRTSALKLLGRCAPSLQGDEVLIAAIMPCLRDREEYVRKQAVAILGDLCVNRDQRIIAAIVERVSDPHHLVRKEAVSVLCKVDEQGAENVLEALRLRLVDNKLAVRRAAVQAMASFARSGNERARVEINACLQDEDEEIKAETRRALASLAEEATGERLVDQGPPFGQRVPCPVLVR